MSLSSLLPKPSLTTYDPDVQQRYKQAQAAKVAAVSSAAVATTGPPPYGQRKGWVPRALADFGDGGAFPEIIVAQYPMMMGSKKKAASNALSLQYDADGTVKYDAIAKQGHRDDKIIHTGVENTIHNVFDEAELQRPDEDTIEQTTDATRQALEKLVNHKISSALPVRRAEKTAPAQYIRFTPAQQGGAYNSGAKQRIIRMVEMQTDPMEPPKFNTTKKIPRGPPSPPVPVLHSPTRKLTAKEQQDWKIPPCVSNWKNAKGYTIPLDKRLAADGRGLQSVTINENFARLAEALFIADRKAREAVEIRAQAEKKMASKEKEKQEAKLRALAAKARMERAGIAATGEAGEDDAAAERDEIRQERHKERARERNIARAAPDKQAALSRDRDRDISEKIALGMPSKTKNDDALFDSRLFNSSQGIGSGFAPDDDTYDVYSEPLKRDSNLATHMYRPSKNIDSDVYGDDLEKLASTKRFVPDKNFSGSSAQGSSRDGPVQFEKSGGGDRREESSAAAAADEEDPFGLEQFLMDAKKGGRKRSGKDDDKSGSSSSKRKR